MNFSIKTVAKLNNGVEIPVLGFGTYLSTGKQGLNATLHALALGYRHIDTAKLYRNEREIGDAIRTSGIQREDIFLTTKLWNADHGYDSTLAAFNQSLEQLGMEYIDLYLIHWPVPGLRLDSWRALEKLYDEGKCRAIGVSNYTIRHLEELLENYSVVPAVNQVEFHPFLFQKDLLEFCRKNRIQLEAYSPLTKGRRLNDMRITGLSEKYGKSPAQLLIRWTLQHDLVVIPKSANKSRIKENADVFDFSISNEDMEELDALDENWRCSWDPSTEA